MNPGQPFFGSLLASYPQLVAVLVKHGIHRLAASSSWFLVAMARSTTVGCITAAILTFHGGYGVGLDAE